MGMVKWDPLQELGAMQERMNRLFELSRGRVYGTPLAAGAWQPTVDIYEDDAEVVVKMELPEVDQKDVDVRSEEQTLVIEGERRLEREEARHNYLRIERSYGPFRRTFSLPANFDEGGSGNVPGVLMKNGEQARGIPLAGLSVKVTNGYFLIGLSSVDTDRGVIRAILAMMSSILALPMIFFCLLLGAIRCAAPASSITSIALSGRWRSLMKRADSSAALVNAAALYLMPWCDSKRCFSPLRISMVCSTEGSGTSIFWKRRDSAWSFSKMPRYS